MSPSSLNLNVGQSSSAYVSIGSYIYSGSYYISSNSNSNVATASISGSTVNVYGNQVGSTTISICQSGGSSSCVSLYVTVGGGSSYGNIYFSPSSLSLNAGQNSTVTIYNNGGSSYGNYYISSNSNSGVASASISGNVLYVSAITNGTTNVSVCQSGYSGCATLYVTVSGAYGGSLSLSQTSVSLSSGQNTSVTAYNAGGLYISSNSNSNIATASVSGNSINIYGNQSGSTTISVCSSYSGCANIYVTVSGGSSYGNIYFGVTNLTLTVGQSNTVSIYNNGNYTYGNYYISSNSNSGVASASISGNSLYVSGLANGTTNIYVCQNSSSNCATLYVTVSGGNNGNNSVWFSPSNPSLYVGQSLAVSVNSSAYAATYPAYNNAYYVSSNSNSGVASASISGTVLNLYAYQNGSTNISVCHSSLGFCGTVYVTVGGGSYGGSLSLSQTNVNVGINQNTNITVYGSGSYYISSNSNSYVANAAVSGNTLSIYGKQIGSTTISICQSGYSGCANVYVNVSNSTYNGGGLQYPGGVLGATSYPNGQLISENGTVYAVYKNTKTGFSSAKVFTDLGFRFANVWEVGSSGLADSGYIVRSASATHPWGTWIKSGTTVYFVHEQGLMPVPDWNTFLNNGGQANFIVNANYYDLSLPRLPMMTYSDTRLQ